MHGKLMREALNEVRSFRDTTEGGPGSGPQKGGKKFSSSEIKKAYGILNDPRYKQGNYTGAAKAINKLAPGLADHPDVKNAMKRANEELEEANRYSVALKGDAKKLFDLSWKAGSKSKAYGDKEWDAAVDDTAKKYRDDNHIRVSDKDIAAVKKAIQYNEFDPSTNENLDLPATGDTTTSNASQEDIVEKNINEVAPIAIAAVIARILSTTVAKNAGSAVKKALSTAPKVAKPAAVATTTTAGSPTTTLPESIENNKVDTTEGYDTGNTRPRDSRGSRLPLNKYPKPKSTIPVPSMNFVGSLTSQKNEAKLSTSQLDTLKQKYSGLRGSEKNGIQMDKLAKIMKRYPKPMLDQLAGLDIPMVSKVAKAMTEETMTEAWQYEMDIEYGDYDDRLIVFGNIRGANLETQADRAYDKLEKEMEKKFGRDIAIEGGVFKGKTNTRSRGVSATGKVDPRESDPIQRKDI